MRTRKGKKTATCRLQDHGCVPTFCPHALADYDVFFMRYPCSRSESGVAVCENALLLDELNGKSATLCQMNRQECFGGNELLIDG